MRRLAVLAVLLSAALAPLGCAGEEGRRAEALLERSSRALAEVDSLRFAGRLWMETPAGDFAFVVRGGASAQGGGSSFVTMRGENVPGFPEVSVVTRGTSSWTNVGTGWIRGELPPGGAAGVEQLDLAPYVKDVSVEDGHEAAGEPAVKVTGVLDTSGLVKGVLGQLGTVDGTALPDAADVLGDTRVVLYVSEASDLTRRLLVDTTMEAAGEEAALHMDLALTPAKRSVRIPRVG